MRNAIMASLILLAFCFLAAPACAGDACPSRQAQCDVKAAQRALDRAEKRLAESKRILAATKLYSARYGARVGRWVRLARRVGFPWSEFDTLMYVVNRESGGDPNAKNPLSTASGLLQFLSHWWIGKFDPFSPCANLSCGQRAVKAGGWSPWNL